MLAPPAPLMQLARAGLVRPLAALPTRHEALGTGFLALDGLLKGGLPRGALTALAGGPSSGAGTLALHLAGYASRTGRLVAWLDAVRGFDPAAARRASIEPSHLLLARPEALPEALSIAYDLLCEGSVGLVLLDAGGMTLPDRELRLLVNAVARSRVALVCLTEPRVDVPLADLRLSVTRLGWEIGDTLALRARVTVENGRHAVGRSVELVLVVEESGPCWSAP
jgi:hypothetical protein